jgi:iron(III) transport system substrate-binding protein
MLSARASGGRLASKMRMAAVVALAMATLATACGTDAGAEPEGILRIYTSVTQDTVDAVVSGFETSNPGATVEVFRAPTGELAARIAAELREDGLHADILWLTDPLSIQQYARDDLLREWRPTNIEIVPQDYRTDTFFGTRVLNLVIVAAAGLDSTPQDWDDLIDANGVVAIPDPGFAGSAFGTLAFFALSPEFGMDYYMALRDNGAVQVRSPGDVVTGVAEGLYVAGITLDRSARAAVVDGSPVVMVWPESGAISMYSPIGVVGASDSNWAEPFVEYVLSEEAQKAIASTGWEPIRTDVEWPESGAQHAVDWAQAFERQDELLEDYLAIFGE